MLRTQPGNYSCKCCWKINFPTLGSNSYRNIPFYLQWQMISHVIFCQYGALNTTLATASSSPCHYENLHLTLFNLAPPVSFFGNYLCKNSVWIIIVEIVNYINLNIILNAIICENMSIILRKIVRPLVITERIQANYLKANVMKLIPVAVLSKA